MMKKHVLDLLEAIIQPPGIVKEELRPILFKIDPKVKSSKMGLSMDPCRFLKRPTLSCNIWPH